METKIMLALIVVAISIGCCEAYGNIYGEKYENIYFKVKLDRRLKDPYHPNPREVSNLLVKANNKDDVLEGSKGLTVDQLLDLSTPFESCYREKFAKYDEWRKLLSEPDGNVYLLQYVEFNIDRLFNVCTKKMNEVFKGLASTCSRVGTYSEKVTKYIISTGEESDPEEKSLQDFFKAKVLNEWQQKDFIQRCAKLEESIRVDLFYFFFDKYGRKTSHNLQWMGDTPEAALFKRCLVVNKLFGKK